MNYYFLVMTNRIMFAYPEVNSGLAKTMGENLVSEGIVSEDQICYVQNGIDAVRSVAEQRIPLLIVDNQRLPGKTGPQVVFDLETAAQHPYHVILTIGVDTFMPKLKHPERLTVLEKPFGMKNLAEVVKKHLPVETHDR